MGKHAKMACFSCLQKRGAEGEIKRPPGKEAGGVGDLGWCQAAAGLTGGWRRRMWASWIIIITWFVVQ